VRGDRDPVRQRIGRAILWLGSLMPFIYAGGETGFDVSLWDAVAGGGGIVALTAGLVTVTRLGPVPWGVAEKSVAAFVLIAALSAAWSVAPMATLLKVMPLATSYLCLALLAPTYASRREAFTAIVRVATLVSIGLVAQRLLIPEVVLQPVSVVNPTLRFASVVPTIGSNLVGIPIAVAVTGVLLGVAPRWAGRAAPLLFPGYLYVLVEARSRVILVVVVVMLIAAALYAAHRTVGRVVLGWLAMVAAFATGWIGLVAFGWFDGLVGFFTRGQDTEQLSSLTGRLELWNVALTAVDERPILGFGYYSGHRFSLVERASFVSERSNLDNTWLESLVDVGVVGAVPLVLFVAVGVWRAVHAQDRAVRCLASLTVGVMVTMSFVNPTVQDPNITMVLGGATIFFLGVRTATEGDDASSGAERSRSSVVARR
jgi:O-antigen ligase